MGEWIHRILLFKHACDMLYLFVSIEYYRPVLWAGILCLFKITRPPLPSHNTWIVIPRSKMQT